MYLQAYRALVVKSCVELLRSCGITIPVVFPTSLRSVWTPNYLPLKIFELATLGACLWRVEFKGLFVVYRPLGKDHYFEGSNCAVKASCSE